MPNVNNQILPAIKGNKKNDSIDSLGVIETRSVASTIIAADKATKTSDVSLIEIRLATGIGGKAFFTLTGQLSDVEASIETAVETLKNTDLLVNKIIIPAPHQDLMKFIL